MSLHAVAMSADSLSVATAIPKSYGVLKEHNPVQTYEQECCPVCLELEKDIKKSDKVVLPCAHMVCKTCYKRFQENSLITCPVCRRPLGIEAITSVTQQNLPLRQSRNRYCRSCTQRECCLGCACGQTLGAIYCCCYGIGIPVYLLYSELATLLGAAKDRRCDVPYCDCQSGDDSWCNCCYID